MIEEDIGLTPDDTISDSHDTSSLSHSQHIISTVIIPKKILLMQSNNLIDQMDGAVFFRRLLAIGNNITLSYCLYIVINKTFSKL